MVPEHLYSDLRDRKGHAADRAGHAVAVRNQLAGGGVALGSVVDALGGGGAAVGRIDQHLVVGVLPEQRLVTLGELRGVLGQVGRVDGEEWLVVRVRIGVVIAGMVVGEAGLKGGLEAPGPGGNAAIGVAGLLAAERRELRTQPRSLFRAHRRPQPCRCEQQHRCGQAEQRLHSGPSIIRLSARARRTQNENLTLAATKLRSLSRLYWPAPP